MREKKKISCLLLLSFVSLVFVSCELQEEVVQDHNYSKNIKIYQKSFDELLTDKKFAKSFNKIPKNKEIIRSNIQGRTVMEQQYGFTITNTPVRVMQVGNLTSYTFHIERDVNDNSYFENLVVQNDSLGNTSAQIIKYTPYEPMTTFVEHNSYIFEGNIEFSSIIYDDTPVILTGKAITVCRRLWGTRCTANDRGACVAPSHVPFSICLTQNCLNQQFISEICTTYDDGESEENDGGGTGIGVSSNNTGGGGGNNNPIYSDPVCGDNCITDAENSTPCEDLKSKTSNNPDYMDRFNELNVPNNYTLPYESGFAERRNNNGGTDYNNLTPQMGYPALRFPSGCFNFTHVHNNNVKEIENELIDVNVKMLSPEDLYALLFNCQTTCTNNGGTATDAYGVMLSNEGIFAITLLEPYVRNTEFHQKYIEFEKNYLRKSEKILFDLSLNAEQRKKKLEKMFLQEVKTLGLGDKIGLFEGTVTNRAGIKNLNWTRKTLNANNTVTENPC